MKYLIKHTLVLLLIITTAFTSQLKADCTITGTVFASNETLNYTYTHQSPEENNYYQLKQIDFDGAGSYSPIKYIRVEDKSKKMRLFPTAVTHQLTVLFNDFQGDTEVEIIDSAGRVLRSVCLTSSRTFLDVSNLSAGTYWLRKVTPSSIESQVFIKN